MISKKVHSLCSDLPAESRLRQIGGVYVIFATYQSGRRIPVKRACGVDRFGILYIGKSSKLRSRIGTLRRMICPRDGHESSGHIFGHTYKRSARLQRQFAPNRLMFSFEYCRDLDQRETKLLLAYLKKFGELPPGNASLPRVLAGEIRAIRRGKHS